MKYIFSKNLTLEVKDSFCLHFALTDPTKLTKLVK